MSGAVQFVGRWKTIPVTKCINHPDRRARARGLCPSCYVKDYYANNERYRLDSQARAKVWSANNPERAKVIKCRAIAKAGSAKIKGRTLKRKYGITIEQFEEMRAVQNSLCAICKKPPTEGRPLHVDHCHSTGRVRGLLCHQCNWYLGKVDSDPALIGRLQQYLEPPNV